MHPEPQPLRTLQTPSLAVWLPSETPAHLSLHVIALLRPPSCQRRDNWSRPPGPVIITQPRPRWPQENGPIVRLRGCCPSMLSDQGVCWATAAPVLSPYRPNAVNPHPGSPSAPLPSEHTDTVTACSTSPDTGTPGLSACFSCPCVVVYVSLSVCITHGVTHRGVCGDHAAGAVERRYRAGVVSLKALLSLSCGTAVPLYCTPPVSGGLLSPNGPPRSEHFLLPLMTDRLGWESMRAVV